jgi:SAM-dependent methyltransferase
VNELWASGAAYEPYVGRWSRPVAVEFLRWLGRPPGGDWLDVGCGTGAVTQTILATAAPSTVVGVDPSEAFVGYARSRVADDRARFEVAAAEALPLPESTVDTVVSGLVLNFVPDQPGAVAEMVRVSRPGGTVAAYVWDYADRMQLMRYFWDVAGELDPAARSLDEANRFAVCQPEPLGALFRDAGLADVAVTPIEVPTVFADFDDYWTPFLAGRAPAPEYAVSLTDEGRTRLREALRVRLPFAGDGTIPLVARAWAVRGQVG